MFPAWYNNGHCNKQWFESSQSFLQGHAGDAGHAGNFHLFSLHVVKENKWKLSLLHIILGRACLILLLLELW